MALFHVDASYIKKGTSEGGATGFATYLERLTPDNATQFRRYLEREGHGADDLVASGHENLPHWASDGPVFWKQADTWERQNGVVGRHYQFTLPQELSAEGRRALADDIRTVFFSRYVHTWAIHAPQAKEGPGSNPHLHVLFSPRRDDTIRECGPKEWFSRAANPGEVVLSGGVRKDGIWDRKSTLQGVRAETAILTNAALEREGCQVAVSHESLRVRGHQRVPEKVLARPLVALLYKHKGKGLEEITNLTTRAQLAYARAQHAEIAVNRVLLHAHFHQQENRANLTAWHAQKEREHIRDLSRAAIRDHVRDRFWQGDRSPAREQERQESLHRCIAREWARTGRESRQEPGPRPRPRAYPPRDWAREDRATQGAHIHWQETSREQTR